MTYIRLNGSLYPLIYRPPKVDFCSHNRNSFVFPSCKAFCGGRQIDPNPTRTRNTLPLTHPRTQNHPKIIKTTTNSSNAYVQSTYASSHRKCTPPTNHVPPKTHPPYSLRTTVLSVCRPNTIFLSSYCCPSVVRTPYSCRLSVVPLSSS